MILCEYMNITHIDHINIVVDDLVGSVTFFEKLGLRKTDRKTLSGDWIEQVVGLESVEAEFVSMCFEEGQTVIELLKYKNPKGGVDPHLGVANQIGYRHIAFNVTEIEEWYKKLTALGIECISEVQEVVNYKNKKMFYFKGPEGILLELMEYPPEG